MEPQLFSRGNHVLTVLLLVGLMQLQWSRSFSAAEIMCHAYCHAHVTQASMEPQLFSRGNLVLAQMGLDGLFGASMEPQLFSRGNQ